MIDPLAEVIGLLRPRIVLWKRIEGRGRWALRFAANPDVNFGVVTTGRCTVRCGNDTVPLTEGDFLLLSGPPTFTFRGEPGGTVVDGDRAVDGTGRLRLGGGDGAPVRVFAGHFAVEEDNAGLLLSLLPTVVHLRAHTDGAGRVARVLELIGDEAGAQRPGASLVLSRLVEVLLVEALRSTAPPARPPARPPAGLVAGLGDPPVAAALRAIHADVARPWTVAGLAAQARVSRSVLAERFTRCVGAPPMEYVLSWRMAVAKRALRQGEKSIAEIARSVGYGSASAFSTAFARVTGSPPGRYARSA